MTATNRQRNDRIKALISRYQAGERTLGNQIMQALTGLARWHATRAKKRGAPGDVQDLTQEALMGAFTSLDRYRPALGGIATYFGLRMQGSITDYLRKQRLRGYGRTRVDRDDAPKVKSYDGLNQSIKDACRPESGRAATVLEPYHDPREWESIDIDDWLEQLSVREQTLLRRYYIDGATFLQIADELGISESRVSQLHKQVMPRLRGRIRNDFGERAA